MHAVRTPTRFWLAVLLLLLLAGCATGPAVRTDIDPQADFGRYRTWAFYEPIAMEANGYTSFTTQRIRDAVRTQMDARGYVYDPATPDLKVNFQGIVEDRTDVYTVPRTDFAWYYSYRARSYVAVPVWYDEAQVRNYRQGTLTIDLVDARANRMVWTGSAIGRVTRKTPQERAVEIDGAVAAIFARYPQRAGGAVP
jgi:hypothetical protein